MQAPATRISPTFIGLTALFIISLIVAGWTHQYAFFLVPFTVLFFIAGWTNISWAFLLLLLSIPFSFEYNFSDSLGTDIPDESLMLLTSLFFLGYWIYAPSSISKKAIAHWLILLLILHMGWMCVATATSTYPLLSAKFILAKGWYIGAFVLAPIIVFRNKKIISAAAVLLAFAMLTVAMMALVRHAGESFNFAAANDAVAPFFRNHVSYSSMLVCVIPLFFAGYMLHKKTSIRCWIALAILILLTALFFSYARGAWLALIFGLAAYWLLKKKILLTAFIVSIVLVVAGLFWLKKDDRYLLYAHDYKTTIYHEDFREHLVATYRLKDVSTAERFNRWVAGVRMIKEKWLTGYGPGTFYDNYKPFGVPAFKTWVSNNPERSTVHNYFLLVAIEQGYIGLVIFLVLLGAMFYYAQYLYHRIKDPFYRVSAITTAVILVMITTVNFLSDLIETDKIGSLFFLCLSVLVMIDLNTRKESETTSHIQRIA